MGIKKDLNALLCIVLAVLAKIEPQYFTVYFTLLALLAKVETRSLMVEFLNGPYCLRANMKNGDMVFDRGGELVHAIFGFCDIRNFTDCTEV